MKIAFIKWTSGFTRKTSWTGFIIDFFTIVQKFTNLAIWIIGEPLTIQNIYAFLQAFFGIVRYRNSIESCIKTFTFDITLLPRSESNPNEKDIVEKLFFSLSGCPKDSAKGASRKEESE